jgi:hypothetical protein
VRRISASTEVRAPGGFALSFLNTHFLEREPGATTAQLHLAVPAGPHTNAPLVEKTVDVTAHLERSPDGTSHVLHIAWQPHGGGPFPGFAGIASSVDTAENVTTLTIDGEYQAPGNIVGAVFDATVGANIALATLTRLLETFRNLIEADYRQRT